MSLNVLLILKVPESEQYGVELRKVNGCIDVSSTEEYHSSLNEDASDRAFQYAKQSSKSIVALQILSSDLYHWGLNDNILSGPAKVKFVGHIREQLLDKSFETAEMLKKKAEEHGIPIEIKKIEVNDICSAALEEACRGYDRIFIAKEKRKIFPLFKKNMEQYLRKNVSIPIES